jgi:hypothetical protein
MNEHAPPETAAPSSPDNIAREAPRLPGSSMPTNWRLPLAYIYQPAPSPTQSAPLGQREWVLEFEPWAKKQVEWLMGWTSSRDPFGSIAPLHFPDRQSAIEFAERHGWPYIVRDPPMRRLQPKTIRVGDLRYDLAGATWRGSAPWDGSVDIHYAFEPYGANAGTWPPSESTRHG